MIRKLFFAIMAVGMMTACNGASEGGENSGSGSAAEVKEAKGAVYEGKSFTMTLPEGWADTYKGDDMLNAKDESGEADMNAAFSDNPCKPDDFTKYADNLKLVKKDFTFEDPKIDGNIMTVKTVNGDKVENNFVVYLDEKGGVAGSFSYPAAKAKDIEPLMMASIKSIKRK